MLKKHIKTHSNMEQECHDLFFQYDFGLANWLFFAKEKIYATWGGIVQYTKQITHIHFLKLLHLCAYELDDYIMHYHLTHQHLHSM